MDIRHAVGVNEHIDEPTLAALADWRPSERFTAREKAALELTEEIVGDERDVSDECFARVRAHFSEADVVELVFVIGYQIFASKFAKTFRLTPQGFATMAAGSASP
jgi:alkylhydroperoxidase family enzyme